jgi:hypothetical protein
MMMDSSDLETALSAGGFNMSVTIEATEASGAEITMADDNAAADASAPADGFSTPVDTDCSVIIEEFCLLSATPVEGATNRYDFNFTIKVASNSQCGTLDVSMDLIQDETYLGHVAVDAAAIADSIACDCDNIFTVTADYTGTAGDVYGQIDIRNSQH